MTTKKPKKRRAKKQTGDRVSRIAAKVMQRLARLPAKLELGSGDWDLPLAWITVGEARALAASALSQDEVRGPRGKR